MQKINLDTMNLEEEEAWLELEERIRSKNESNAIADRGNETGKKEETNSTGSLKYTPCECGYRDIKVPLTSHSEWCGYKKWRLYEEDQERKRKEYGDIRIWF